MKKLAWTLGLLSLLLALGCNGNGGDEDTDAVTDPTPDPDAGEDTTPPDVPPDQDAQDPLPDTTPDTEPDTSPDVEPDTTPDGEDVTPDTEPDVEPDAVECTATGTIADVRAAADGAIDIMLCNVFVTYVFEDGYFIQVEATGPGIEVYEGTSWTPDVAVGDEINMHATNVTSYNGTKEIDAHDAVVQVSTGNDVTTLIQALSTLDVSPSEDLESELVSVIGATVTGIAGRNVTIDYASQTGVTMRVADTSILCVGATFDVLAVVTEFNTAHQVESFSSADFSNIDTSACSSSPLAGALIVNEFLADPPAGVPGDANCDGTRDGADDEFVEIVNVTSDPVTLDGITVSDGSSMRHTFAASTLDPGKAVVIFGGGTPGCTTWPSDVIVVTASSGQLGLNNAGDTVTITDSIGNTISAASWGAEGDNNQSLTLNPDLDDTNADPLIVEGFTGHVSADTADGSAFSPGTHIDGTAF